MLERQYFRSPWFLTIDLDGFIFLFHTRWILWRWFNSDGWVKYHGKTSCNVQSVIQMTIFSIPCIQNKFLMFKNKWESKRCFLKNLKIHGIKPILPSFHILLGFPKQSLLEKSILTQEKWKFIVVVPFYDVFIERVHLERLKSCQGSKNNGDGGRVNWNSRS